MVALWMPGQGPNLPECLADISTWNATWREVDGAFQTPDVCGISHGSVILHALHF